MSNCYKNLSISSWNVHGLGDKLKDELFIENLKGDINILLETWKGESKEFKLEGHCIISKSRKKGKKARRYSGGIIVTIKKPYFKGITYLKEATTSPNRLWLKLNKNWIKSYKWTENSKLKLIDALLTENVKNEIIEFEMVNYEENQVGVDEATEKLTKILDNISSLSCKATPKTKRRKKKRKFKQVWSDNVIYETKRQINKIGNKIRNNPNNNSLKQKFFELKKNLKKMVKQKKSSVEMAYKSKTDEIEHKVSLLIPPSSDTVSATCNDLKVEEPPLNFQIAIKFQCARNA
ncbi:unnamed protein product [Mytilus edulis]|uniref:Uncharacterized protein n=1 Tax=Mytilus edulis TaxID=6550 RepID=A0A8S3U1N0_MYTED|nr:unnamed protein product [Mytilus edulis]